MWPAAAMSTEPELRAVRALPNSPIYFYQAWRLRRRGPGVSAFPLALEAPVGARRAAPQEPGRGPSVTSGPTVAGLTGGVRVYLDVLDSETHDGPSYGVRSLWAITLR
jgi:hypothetical protein